MGNRVRSRERSRRRQPPHIPNQEQAGAQLAGEVKVQVYTKAGGQVGVVVVGGKDAAHRQLMLFRGLEIEMRKTMCHYQEIQALMDAEPEAKKMIEDWIEGRNAEREAAAKDAGATILTPTDEDTQHVEHTKARG